MTKVKRYACVRCGQIYWMPMSECMLCGGHRFEAFKSLANPRANPTFKARDVLARENGTSPSHSKHPPSRRLPPLT